MDFNRMESDPDNNVEFTIIDTDDFKIESYEDACLALAGIRASALLLEKKYGRVIYPIFKTYEG